jgi:outer membrane protein OmpA-like peptidoglycan-associated protein
MKTQINKILLTATSMLLIPSCLTAMEIRQDMYSYQMGVSRDVTCNTFVIASSLPHKKIRSVTSMLSVVPFALGSAVLSQTTEENIFLDLQKSDITKNSSLTVTGHTCRLGPEKFNQTLSLQRAQTVADFLKKHEFTVTAMQGKGSTDPVTQKSTELYQNRRVVIEKALKNR